MTTTRLASLLLLPLALASCADERAALTPPTSSASPAPPVAAPPVATPPSVAPPASPAGRVPARPAAPGKRRASPAAPAEPVTKPVTKPAAGPGAPRAEVVAGAETATADRWTLRVTLRTGDVVTGVVQAERDVRPDVLGVVDADRDGDHEVFVRVGGGASTTAYAVFTLVEDGMAEVRTDDGQPVRLLVGGSVTHGDGFRCGERSLTVLSVVSEDGETFRGTAIAHSWRDDRVTATGRTTFAGRASDPQVREAYGIRCGSLSQG